MNTEPYAAAKPRQGDPVLYNGEFVGKVIRVEGNLCWVDYKEGPNPFIWRFKDGLNQLHTWPSKNFT